MAQNFRPCDRDQQLLLAPDMREWLDDDHLVWFVLEVVEELDLASFYARYRDDGQGATAHDPKMMVGLWLYAYAVGESSTRKIEQRLREDVAFRVLAANQHPDHTTLARFRAGHQDALAGLFSQILALCERAGLLKGGAVAIDGTKLHANASLSANRTPEQIRAEVDRYFEESERIDAEEDELYGKDKRGDELPEQLRDRDSRRAAIRRAKQELEREAAEREAKHAEMRANYQAQIERTGRRPTGRPPGEQPPMQRKVDRRNLTDYDSRVVRDKGCLIQGYNAQAAVCEGQLIVAADLTNEPNDTRQLEPMAEATLRQLDAPTLLADTGYWNSAQIKALSERGIEVIVATSAPRKDRTRKQGRRLGPEAERIDRLLATEEGAELYGRRKYIVEPVFGQIKHLRGLRRLSRRGLEACRAEWRLIAATHNLLKLRAAAQAA